jgi:hypothetical protein
MNSQRPYFPFDVLDVPAVSYAKLSPTACEWNLKFESEGCVGHDLEGQTVYAKVEWNAVRYDVKKEEFQNGLGDTESEFTRVDRTYSFVCWCDEYILWFIYQIIYASKKVNFITSEDEAITGHDCEIEHEELGKGYYKVTISYKVRSNDNLRYHDAFGINGCCESLYGEAPYEGCSENGGEIDNYEPPCDDVEFSVTESGNTLTANVSGTPSTYTVAWYWRANAQSAWSLLINGASSVSLGSYGIYRAVLTAAACGQYLDQYLYSDPCALFDVRIRRSTGNGVVAEVPTGFTGTTFAWEFNDGTGWVDLDDTVAAIVALETGDYRVTATNGDCEDVDVFYILVNETDDCDFELSITKSGATATAVTDAVSPTYLWSRENETGQINVGSASVLTMTETGIYWLTVTSGDCVKRAYTFFKANDDCLKVEICNPEDFNLTVTPNITVNACCDEEDCNANITIICVNKVLIAIGMPGTATIEWSGPSGYTHSGNGALVSVGGEYTATITDGDCEWEESYVFVRANAGTSINGDEDIEID